MKLPPMPLLLLLVLYVLLTALAIGRLIVTGAPDMFTLGVIPVLIGILLRSFWALWALRIYIAVQTLGFAALGVTAILATRISPEDARLFIGKTELPIPVVALCAALLLGFQWWVAFHRSTRSYLEQAKA